MVSAVTGAIGALKGPLHGGAPGPALDMVFEKRTERREERAEKVRSAQPQVEDVSVFPMAMPMIAGPGSIATIMLLMARAEGTPQTLVILTALLAVFFWGANHTEQLRPEFISNVMIYALSPVILIKSMKPRSCVCSTKSNR